MNQGDEHGMTPLVFAGWMGHLDVLKLLFDHGADVNHEDENSITSVNASTGEHRDMVQPGAAANNLLTTSSLTHVLQERRDCENSHQFSDCLMLMLLAGSHVKESDLQLMRSLDDTLVPRRVLDYATEKCGRPASLKRQCKFLLRTLVRKPLSLHLPQTGLPEYLQRYVLLKEHD